jgi:hypothetical protein
MAHLDGVVGATLKSNFRRLKRSTVIASMEQLHSVIVCQRAVRRYLALKRKRGWKRGHGFTRNWRRSLDRVLHFDLDTQAQVSYV